MKKIYYIIFAVFACLTSCRSDFDWRFKRMDDFGKDFVDMYGWPDANQNWNTATQYKIGVSVEEPGDYTIRVYSANPLAEPNKAYLLGEFETPIEGSTEVTVDGPYTLESIYVGISNVGQFSAKSIAVNGQAKLSASFSKDDMMPGMLPLATKMSYFLAYEIVDSAATYLDYNDIVLEVIHVSGEDKATVKLHAVGAKEEMKVFYREDRSGDNKVLFEDAHRAFGYHKTETLVNVESGNHNYRTPITYRDLNVGKDFSILEHANRFKVTVPSVNDDMEFSIWPNTEDYRGIPSYCMVVANPQWDWVSESDAIEKRHRSFPAWVKGYRIYNSWWDTVWDPHELLLIEDGETYRPDFDYLDMIYSYSDVQEMGDTIADISYERLRPYAETEIGANIAFVLIGRNQGRIKISLERTDGGIFEWYPVGEDGKYRAYVDVYDKSINIDAGVGRNAEACHILISRKTMQQIINERANLHVIFEPLDTRTTINSVWIRER